MINITFKCDKCDYEESLEVYPNSGEYFDIGVDLPSGWKYTFVDDNLICDECVGE